MSGYDCWNKCVFSFRRNAKYNQWSWWQWWWWHPCIDWHCHCTQVGHTANDGGATTLAIHCWPPSIHCAGCHCLELLAGRPPCTAPKNLAFVWRAQHIRDFVTVAIYTFTLTITITQYILTTRKPTDSADSASWIRFSSGICIWSPDPEFQSDWPSRFTGEFLDHRQISGEIFTKIQSAVFTWS